MSQNSDLKECYYLSFLLQSPALSSKGAGNNDVNNNSSILNQPVQFYDLSDSIERSKGSSSHSARDSKADDNNNSSNSKSVYNDEEVEFVSQYLTLLCHHHLALQTQSNNSTNSGITNTTNNASSNAPTNTSSSGSIGILSPYKLQVNKLKNRLASTIQHLKQLTTNNTNNNSSSTLSSLSAHVLKLKLKFYQDIEVNTIDGYQGKEKHIIIFSCVRTSTRGIGFLGDDRRINVSVYIYVCAGNICMYNIVDNMYYVLCAIHIHYGYVIHSM